MSTATLVNHGAVAVVGAVGNLLTLATVLRDKVIQTQFSFLLRSLIVAEAFVDALFCLVGLPLRMLNLSIGYEASGTILGGHLCTLVYGGTFRLVKLSFWLLLAIGVTRFSAVFTPLLYRTVAEKSSLAAAALISGAFLASSGTTVYGIYAGWLAVNPVPCK